MSTHRTLEAGAPGMYYNRNRWYMPKYGRFLTRDPMETAVPLITAATRNAQAMSILLSGFEAMGHYGDGMNLYGYLGANPVNRRDALGLYWDPFEEADDIISEINGNRLYTIGTLNEAASWASIGLQTAWSISYGFLPGAGFYDAWNSVQLLRSGQGGFWDALNIAMAAVPFVKGAVGLFKAVGKATGFWRRADHLGDAAKGLCRLTSFVAGTTVATPSGPIPIEQLRPGDEILTRDDADPATLAAEAGYVKRVFKRIAPAVVWLTLLDGTTIGVTPEHEVYTEEQGWRYVSELEASSSLVDASGAPLTIVAIDIDPTPRPVYNLETSCGTYFAQGVWAHNAGFGDCVRKVVDAWAKTKGKAVFAKRWLYSDRAEAFMLRADFDPEEYVPRLDGDGDVWVGNVRLGNVFSNDYFFD